MGQFLTPSQPSNKARVRNSLLTKGKNNKQSNLQAVTCK